MQYYFKKKKKIHEILSKNQTMDQKLQGALKKLGVSPIGDIEEVNLIMDNGMLYTSRTPKFRLPSLQTPML